MSEPQIRALLESRLAPWAAARSLPVAWQNVAFTPQAGQTYLRAFVLASETESRDLAGAHRGYRGIWQVNIVAPTGGGAGAGEALAAELADLYPMNLRLGDLQIVSAMSVREVPSDEFVLACWCRYRMDTW